MWSTFFDPGFVLDQLSFGAPMEVVEFGCGFGTFTVAAARRTTGPFHALDIDPAMLDDPNMANVRTITLSYTFFRLDEPVQLSGAATGARVAN
mgnify:CR=1 FL=1